MTTGLRLSLLLAALLAAVAAGCGGGGGDGGGDGGGEVERSASDTLAIVGFGPGDEVAQARIARAKKAIAPAKVQNPEGGFDDQQFLTAIAAGDVPDLVYMTRQKVGTYAARGALQPLTSCIDDQAIDVDQYRDAAIAEVTYDGEIYGIPEFFDNRTVIVNGTLAEQEGVPIEAFDTSDWERLRQTAVRLTERSGGDLTRIGFDPKLPEFFPLWAKANGVDILGADGAEANLDDPRAIEALEYAVGLIDAQGGWDAFKAFRDTFDFFGAGNQFAENQLGAFPMEAWYYNVLAETAPQVDIVALPFKGRDGETIDYTSGSAWAVPARAEHPELACLWAKTITETESWLAAARARLAANERQVYPFTGLYTGNEVADREIMETLYEPDGSGYADVVEVVMDAQEQAFSLPASPASNEFLTAWQNAVNRVLAGQQSAEAALKQAQREAQAAIDAAS